MSLPHEDIGFPPVHPAVMAFLAICLMLWCAACGVSVAIDVIHSVFFHAMARSGAPDWAMAKIVFAFAGIPAFAILRNLHGEPDNDRKG